MDMCLLSASCIMRSIQFEVTIEAEKDTDLWIIPAEIYKGIMKDSAHAAKSQSLIRKAWKHYKAHKNILFISNNPCHMHMPFRSAHDH